jgi:glycosyltransferase involved in cell wall biosynthesis
LAERIGAAEVRFIPYQANQESVARYYEAADLYVHAAPADTFPNTILEALACGTPVVATAVGGIPEQVEDGQTGFLVPVGNARALAERLTQLLSDHQLTYYPIINSRNVGGYWLRISRAGNSIFSDKERPILLGTKSWWNSEQLGAW